MKLCCLINPVIKCRFCNVKVCRDHCTSRLGVGPRDISQKLWDDLGAGKILTFDCGCYDNRFITKVATGQGSVNRNTRLS